MKRGLHPKGFTIVETMIFLAVSGAILVSALTLVGGSQNKAQFNTALNDFNEQITKVINNTANGYYPSSNTKCKDDGTKLIADGAVPAGELGVNQACVYLGRVIEFSDDEYFDVYNIVGLRESLPGVANTDIATSNSTAFGSPERINLKNGIKIKEIKSDGSDYTALGFFTSLGNKDSGSGQLLSGSLSTDYKPLNDINGLGWDNGVPPMIEGLSFRNNYTTNLNPPKGIRICISSATTNQVGILTIGGPNNAASSTSLTVQGSCS